MTDIEQKALALVNASSDEWYQRCTEANVYELYEAICRAIEQHEAFRQEVSDALKKYFSMDWNTHNMVSDLHRFIIPKPKPDPLVAVLHEVDTGPEWDSPEDYCNKIRAALGAVGFEIREKNDD